jgi:hypothetical protein
MTPVPANRHRKGGDSDEYSARAGAVHGTVADPVPRLILAVDVEGSTQRTNPVKGELRRIMYVLLYRALILKP